MDTIIPLDNTDSSEEDVQPPLLDFIPLDEVSWSEEDSFHWGEESEEDSSSSGPCLAPLGDTTDSTSEQSFEEKPVAYRAPVLVPLDSLDSEEETSTSEEESTTKDESSKSSIDEEDELMLHVDPKDMRRVDEDRLHAIITALDVNERDIPNKVPQTPQSADQRCQSLVSHLHELSKGMEIHSLVGSSMPDDTLDQYIEDVSKHPTYARAASKFIAHAQARGYGFPAIVPLPRAVEETFMRPADPARRWETPCSQNYSCQAYIMGMQRSVPNVFVARSYVPPEEQELHLRFEIATRQAFLLLLFYIYFIKLGTCLIMNLPFHSQTRQRRAKRN